MSRSNGPATQSGGWPPAGHPAGADQVPQTRPPRPNHIVQPQGQAPQPPGQPYPADPRQAQGYYTPQGYSGYDDVPMPPGYAPPGSQSGQQQGYPAADPYAAPGYPPRQQAAPQPYAYAPQFDPYLPPQGNPAQQGHQDGQPGQQRPSAYSADATLSQLNAGRQRTGSPDYPLQQQAPPAEYAADARQRGYDQWQAPPAGLDPHGFDLGAYQPEPRTGGGGHRQPAGEPSFNPQQPVPRYAPEPPPQTGYGFDPNAPAPRYGEAPPPFGSASQGFEPQMGLDAQHGYDPNAYDMPQGQPAYRDYAGQGYDQAPADGQDPAQYDQDGQEDEYEDEPPRRSKMLYAVAALAVAVVVGGGLAFAYQKFYRASGTQTATPLVKEKGGPSKVKPSDPGGKQFANRDSKMMDRLSSNTSQGTGDAGSSASDGDGGAKRVQTLVVTRDGSIAPPTAGPAYSGGDAAPRPAPPTVSVPGMTVVDGFGNRPPPRPQPSAAAQAPVVQAPVAQAPIVVSPPAAPQAKPVVVARAAGPTAVDAAETAEAPAKALRPAAPASRKTPVPKKIAAASPAGTAVAPARTGAGYVAVLASVPVSGTSRMDALKQFADMQQKYGSALQGKTPDVQEANLGERGKYHRLLVGPPGSRDHANGVCSQLKAAGYSGCWILGY